MAGRIGRNHYAREIRTVRIAHEEPDRLFRLRQADA
jgi:hypothetical protein